MTPQQYRQEADAAYAYSRSLDRLEADRHDMTLEEYDEYVVDRADLYESLR